MGGVYDNEKGILGLKIVICDIFMRNLIYAKITEVLKIEYKNFKVNNIYGKS
jgi:hypothetical protein